MLGRAKEMNVLTIVAMNAMRLGGAPSVQCIDRPVEMVMVAYLSTCFLPGDARMADFHTGESKTQATAAPSIGELRRITASDGVLVKR